MGHISLWLYFYAGVIVLFVPFFLTHKRFCLQDELVKREVRLAAAIESVHAEELRLDEKLRELDEVQAAYDVLMQQRQVSLRSVVVFLVVQLRSLAV